ncbi:hypothetical protein GCM10025865_00990 [Paraoerskovia sediminicola]|uniref:Uncharacterized protein n=1 Tax=Paraoerskovia sediminicola TaxID=1138587 RepID=A0ABN6XAJ2_9CELL|nr:hypothetical protein [Paraoerskovia sediminicola]BDZ40800.1 hypothetical protein GCM10025865_00990 [Paraoerskovia sediminicola]
MNPDEEMTLDEAAAIYAEGRFPRKGWLIDRVVLLIAPKESHELAFRSGWAFAEAKSRREAAS